MWTSLRVSILKRVTLLSAASRDDVSRALVVTLTAQAHAVARVRRRGLGRGRAPSGREGAFPSVLVALGYPVIRRTGRERAYRMP